MQEKLLESDGILVLFNDKRNHWTFMVQYIYLKLAWETYSHESMNHIFFLTVG